MKTALIFGASGLTGNLCLIELLNNSNYGKVISVNRSPLMLPDDLAAHPKLQQCIVDFNHLENHQAQFNVNDVYCCLGTTIKKAKSVKSFEAIDLHLISQIGKMAKVAYVDKFLVISSLGANPKASSFYAKTKGRMEQALQALKIQHLIIIRPSLLVGNREEFRLLEHLSVTLYKWFGFLFCGPLVVIKPIECELVAKALVNYANDVPLTKEAPSIDIIENKFIRQIANKN